jgi:hypothetical protein
MTDIMRTIFSPRAEIQQAVPLQCRKLGVENLEFPWFRNRYR